MTLLYLILLLVRITSAAFTLTCGPVAHSRPALSALALPVVNLISHLLHSSGDVTCPRDVTALEFTSRSVASWPQYATNTSLRVSGFAFAADACRSLPRFRRTTLTQLLRLTFAYNRPPMPIPLAYVSHSLAGARISVKVENLTLAEILTNQYGHFDATINHSLSTNASGFAAELSVGECDSPLNLGPTIPPEPKSVKIIPIAPNGLTLVSDIDDVLKVSESWNLKQLCINTFVKAFKPQPRVSEVLRAWEANHPGTHFHYTTDAPEMSYEAYLDTQTHYPLGSFDFRPMQLDGFFTARHDNIERLILAAPDRRYVLLGDDSTPGQLSTYVKLARAYPDAVTCIVIRRVSETRPDNMIVPNMKQLHGVRALLYTDPAQLPRNLDHLAARCDASTGLKVPRGGSGWFLSWWYTIINYADSMMICGLLFEARPMHDCVRDRRPGTVYWDGRRLRDEL